ncbi:MAG: molybdenum cofactor synthesis domain-containing protein [Gammaproteobacteria bacterium]|jgi:molybdenum cofactor synthesis domain-containing protein
MNQSSEVTAGIIIIGNEVLSGRTQDTNLAYMGKQLDALGISIMEARVIPDVEQTIIDTVNHFRETYTYVFTTGGIGPTHDDITSAAIAKTFNVNLEKNPQAVSLLEKYYEPGGINEARMKMAHIPEGAKLIDNPLSHAPGFQMENVFVMAGVPSIMQLMFDGITNRLVGGETIITVNVATNIGEGVFAADLEKLQDEYPDISIGSYPYFRKGKLGVNLVMRSTNTDRLRELKEKLTTTLIQLGGKILDSSE